MSRDYVVLIVEPDANGLTMAFTLHYVAASRQPVWNTMRGRFIRSEALTIAKREEKENGWLDWYLAPT